MYFKNKKLSDNASGFVGREENRIFFEKEGMVG